MSLADSLLPEIDRELAITRSLLAVVPEDAPDWRPHAKSMSMGELAAHTAVTPIFFKSAVEDTEFDAAPVGKPKPEFAMWQGREAALATFDKFAADGRAGLVSLSDADLFETWNFVAAGTPFYSMPRVAAIRSFFLNHMIHHRGQLSVYLRLRDVPVPQIYGPSADFPM
jgi:uncharacterized damage-inducible protein DinB